MDLRFMIYPHKSARESSISLICKACNIANGTKNRVVKNIPWGTTARKHIGCATCRIGFEWSLDKHVILGIECHPRMETLHTYENGGWHFIGRRKVS